MTVFSGEPVLGHPVFTLKQAAGVIRWNCQNENKATFIIPIFSLCQQLFASIYGSRL
jgi:hypothetical protein